MNKLKVNPRLINAINRVIEGVNHHSKTANHFCNLKTRLAEGKKLTPKMEQNLGWIMKDNKITEIYV